MTIPAAGTVPVVISYGMGVDSTAILARWILEPASRNFPLTGLTVITAMTGDEWASTGQLVEDHILPLLAAHHIRYVQVARHGPSTRDGVTWLNDSRTPRRVHLAGDYPLSVELLTAGTVPQSAHGRRICSAKQKGAVLDTAIGRLTAGRRFRHILGFAAGEQRRADRDRSYSGTLRHSEYPLIEWGWTRDTSLAYLRGAFGVTWEKSACVFCPFAVHRGSGTNEEIFARYLAEPDEAVRTLLLEYGSRCVNPRQTLLADRALADVFAADGRFDAILAGFAAARDQATHSVIEVRRIVGPGAPAMRSTRQRSTGTRAAMTATVIALAAASGHPARFDGVTYRVQLRARAGPGGVEHALVVAPAWVAAKQRARFEAAWATRTGAVVQPDLFDTSPHTAGGEPA
jgi:hypothetical protein